MNPIHHIQTDRLHIRRFVPADLGAAAALLDACFGPAPRAVREEWLTWQVATYRALEHLRQVPYGDYAVEDRRGQLVGSVGLVQSYGPFGRLAAMRALGVAETAGSTPELGLFWAVTPERRGEGLATEAARALSTWVFAHLGAARLVATTEDDNAPSIAVMRRLGMTVERAPDETPAWFQTVGVLGRLGRS